MEAAHFSCCCHCEIVCSTFKQQHLRWTVIVIADKCDAEHDPGNGSCTDRVSVTEATAVDIAQMELVKRLS